MRTLTAWISALSTVALVGVLSSSCSGDDEGSTDTGTPGGTGGDSSSSASPAGGTGGSGGSGGDGTGGSGAGTGSRGPAYEAGTAGCPDDDGTRHIKIVNNCTSDRWLKLDGRTTPTWARPTDCPWNGAACTDLEGVGQCTAIAQGMSGGVNPGNVYCKATGQGTQGACACNPYFELAPGEEHTIDMPDTAGFASGTGWLATDCNAHGHGCALGNDAAKNSLFEFTYDPPGQGRLYYDISAVNAWTTVSPIGMKSCGGGSESTENPNDVFWCRGTGCRFDVNTQCPDGSDAFAPAPDGCNTCPTMVVNGKQVIVGSCGTCPDGADANRIPTNTVFNANNVGGPEWIWTGSPDFAAGFGHDEGVHANRRYTCGDGGCTAAAPGEANTCLGGCDLCTTTQNAAAGDDACLKYCCPDLTRTYGGATYRYDSAGCTALGVQAGTDYSPAVKGECPYVYTFGYEDHSSTFLCTTSASLLIQACPDAADFPSSFED
ncbi:hypothetical protein [Chondromyces apiculatus]|uniref:Uncharacterized protein n=1 Tax=Chondromyces apiculatus DSM 436 TaxID=1192034 RepID=A0A017T0Q8_9BACT|nr:hypothetical protein [Chondromyces apiculatus]EYF02818.1 Hypothetical protein CAP_6553 [Chondromyces apiculatus DSM 436]